MRRLLAVGVTVLLLTGVDVRPAVACSCAGGVPLDERVAEADVLLVGTVAEIEDGPAYLVDVEEQGGQLVPSQVRVDGFPGCEPTGRVGARVGWLVSRIEGRLVVSTCSEVDPGELADRPEVRPVAAPTPDPGDPPGLDESPLFPIGGALLAVGALLGAVVWLDRR